MSGAGKKREKENSTSLLRVSKDGKATRKRSYEVLRLAKGEPRLDARTERETEKYDEITNFALRQVMSKIMRSRDRASFGNEIQGLQIAGSTNS
ncbi:hypothetical protein RUM43_012841 [Polyplax serrata]|uniref:Uncharacterized protein n=1 Tax=Polyplax serrata TaxID=468196 RepID=A0AAN8P665_POLSC